VVNNKKADTVHFYTKSKDEIIITWYVFNNEIYHTCSFNGVPCKTKNKKEIKQLEGE